CKHVLNYAIEHNKFVDQNLPIIDPLLVCGLVRTGTTLLYNLLACDPQSRAPLYTDIDQLSDLLIRISASHAHFPIEEDSYITRQAGYSPMLTLLSHNEDDDTENWIRNEISNDYAYDYHEIFWAC
ncbi:unnamed protein product, partial [Rotaria sordida]